MTTEWKHICSITKSFEKPEGQILNSGPCRARAGGLHSSLLHLMKSNDLKLKPNFYLNKSNIWIMPRVMQVMKSLVEQFTFLQCPRKVTRKYKTRRSLCCKHNAMGHLKAIVQAIVLSRYTIIQAFKANSICSTNALLLTRDQTTWQMAILDERWKYFWEHHQ